MSDATPNKPSQPTHPQVARVLRNDQVVINAGFNKGLKLGDRFLIYELSDDEITDPNTGESLGRLEIPKGTGRIVGVQDRMAVLESDRELKGSSTNLFTAGLDILTPGAKAPFRSPEEGDYAKRLFP